MKKNKIYGILGIGVLTFLVGCGTPSVAGSVDQINIGILGPESGNLAVFGVPAVQGKLLYIRAFNEGNHGFTINYNWFDEEGSPAQAVLGYDFLMDWGMDVLLGSVTSGATLAVVPLANTDNIPMMSATSSHAAVTVNQDTGAVWNNVFRTTFIDPFQGQRMAEFSNQVLGATRVAVLYSHDIDYSIGLMQTFISRSQELGVEIVSTESFSDGAVDFFGQLTNIVATNPDVLFIPVYTQHMALIGPQSVQAGLDTVMLGADGWVGAVGDMADPFSLEGSFFMSGFSAESTDPIVVSFIERYEEAHGYTPNMFAALGYDAAKIMIDAIRIALESDYVPGTEAFSNAVIENMSATDIHGVTGHITFDQYNNPQKSAFITEIVNGEEVLWGPF